MKKIESKEKEPIDSALFNELSKAWLEKTTHIENGTWTHPTTVYPGIEAMINVLTERGCITVAPDELSMITARRIPSLMLTGTTLTFNTLQEHLFGSLWSLAPGIVFWSPSFNARYDSGILELAPRTSDRLHSWSRGLFAQRPRDRGDNYLSLHKGVISARGQQFARLTNTGLVGGEIILEYGDSGSSAFVTEARWNEMTAQLDAWLA